MILQSIIKSSYKWVEYIVTGIWGLTIIDLIPFLGTDIFTNMDSLIKTLMASAGLVYFILKGLHNHKMNKLERDAKRIENDKLREELESMEIENEKKS